MKVKFNKPIHGWLPVTLNSDGYTLEFEASDVPVDPLSELSNSLHRVLTNRESEVWWHLEPSGYFFKFIKSADNSYELKVSYSEDSSEENKKVIKVLDGNIEQLLMPFWRALKEFYSHNYSEPHWPSEEGNCFEVLSIVIKECCEKVNNAIERTGKSTES